MNQSLGQIYVSPVTKAPLTLQGEQIEKDRVISGSLVDPSGKRYPIVDGIPYLLDRVDSAALEVQQNRVYYETVGQTYDIGMDWLFQSFFVDEQVQRSSMVDLLELQSDSRVLEIGAGTCRDSLEIARRLGHGGEVFISDLSPNMLFIGRSRIENELKSLPLSQAEFLLCDANSLPFPDEYFDAVYHFGGLNLFDNQQTALAEITRVVRLGGKVVIGDEGIPPWLRQTMFAKILVTANPLYQHEPPLDKLPPSARDVSIQWILGNAFYLISYRVGKGEPPLNLDLPIPGRRGGTLRTRYYGLLEGVTPEIKERVLKAAADSGMSVQHWLENVLKDHLNER
jgi:ubiquinone/menaquinone biosynthesis C-methylase UbiE